MHIPKAEGKIIYAKYLLGKELYEVEGHTITGEHPGHSQERQHSHQYVNMALEVGTLRRLYVKEIGQVQLCQRDGDHKLSPYRHMRILHHGQNG